MSIQAQQDTSPIVDSATALPYLMPPSIGIQGVLPFVAFYHQDDEHQAETTGLNSKAFNFAQYPETLTTTLDGQVIVLNLTNGYYFTLQGATQELWKTLHSGPLTQTAIINMWQMCYANHQAISSHVAEAITQLEHQGLIIRILTNTLEPSR